MANYFSNLIDRIRQQAEVVRPRPVSLFEPSEGEQEVSFISPELTPDEVQSPGEKTEGQNQSSPQVQPAKDKNRPRGHSAAAASDKNNRTLELKEAAPDLGYLAHRTTARPTTESVNAGPDGQNPDPHVPTAKPAAGQPNTRNGEGTDENANLPTDPEISTVQPMTKRLVQHQESEPPRAGKTIQITPIRQPLPAGEEGAAESKTEINVTIGRIEVRAVPPPGPSEKRKISPTPNPVMRLDEYLDKRDREGQP